MGNWNGVCAERLAPDPRNSAPVKKIARPTTERSHFNIVFVDLLRGVVEAEHQLIGLLARAVGREHQPPSLMRREIIGAAIQRPLASFSPHWPKMTKWRPGLAAEYCSSSQAPFSSNLISMAKPPFASMTLARDDVGFRQNRLALDGDQHGIGAEHGDGLAGAGGVGNHFDMHAQGGDLPCSLSVWQPQTSPSRNASAK